MNRETRAVEALEGADSTATPIARMQALVLRIVDSRIPPEMRKDPETVRQARTVLTFASVLIALEMAASWFLHFSTGDAALRVDVSLAVALGLTLAIPASFRRTGSPQARSNAGGLFGRASS